jgi:Domain of unknown function (DUF5076)
VKRFSVRHRDQKESESYIMKNFAALNVPPAAIEQGGAEIMRAAIANGELYMSLRRGFDDPEGWGRILADTVKHVSQIYATETKFSKADAAKRILEAFAQEMASDAAGGGPGVAARN